MNRPVHFELAANDPEKLVAFYSETFGWKISKWDGPMDYWLITTGDDETNGINGAIISREVLQQAVVNTIEVASMDRALESVGSNGGSTVAGPREIPGVGMHAYCVDPEGTVFGLLQPA